MVNVPVFSHAEITEQVNKINRSSNLKNSPVLCQFLQFVVEETLAGRGDRIKEYTIGTKVLGRKSDFDPQIDAIVRIHAGRLRRALSEFYSNDGKEDSLRITIPKGGYAPSFVANGQEDNIFLPVAGQQRHPVLAVMPFRNISLDAAHEAFSDGLGEFLSTELARFQELAVISYSSCLNAAAKTKDICEIHNLLGAEYILTGSIFSDQENLRMLIQLSHGDSGRQLWSNSFIRKNASGELFEIQEEIVTLITAALGGYYGVIYRHVSEDSRTKLANHDPIFWYDQFIKYLDEKTFINAVESIEQAVDKNPDNALGWAVLGEIYAAGVVMGFKRVDNQIETAILFSKKAVKLDPLGQHGYQALAASNLIAQNKTAAILAAEQCIEINPRAVTFMSGMGGILIFAGEFESGAKLLNKALLLNPYFPWMRALAFSMYHYNLGEFDKAKAWADKMDMPGIPWCSILKAASLAEMGQSSAAVAALNELIALVPNITILGKSYIGRFILDEPLLDKLMAGLTKAGLIFSKQAVESIRLTVN